MYLFSGNLVLELIFVLSDYNFFVVLFLRWFIILWFMLLFYNEWF